MRISVAIGVMTILALLKGPAYGGGQEWGSPRVENVGFPWDWSDQHLVFSEPTDRNVLLKIQQDPRLRHQQLKRNSAALQATTDRAFSGPRDTSNERRPASPQSAGWTRFTLASPQTAAVVLVLLLAAVVLRQRDGNAKLLTVLASAFLVILASCGGVRTSLSPPPAPQTLRGDWGANIGHSMITPNANNAPPMYPAKYTFNVNLNPNCTSDYVVFPTGAAGTNTGGNPTPSILAFNELYTSQAGGVPAGFCGTTGPSVAWAYLNVTCATSTTTSSDPILSSPVISLDGTKVAWVTSTGKVQILTIGTVGSNGSSVTNPVCIENAPGGTATTPNNAVLNSVTLTNAKQNGNPASVSLSEIFVDYNSDSGYVGDDDGYLHKITPFFAATGALQEVKTASWQAAHTYTVGTLIVDSNGFIEECTAAIFPNLSGATQPNWNKTWGGTTTDLEITWTNEGSAGGWPVFVTGVSNHIDNSQLSGPVFDFVSKNVFIGDQHGSLFYVLDPGASTAVGSCANGASPILYPCLGTPGTTSGIAHGGGAQQDCATATPSATCMVMSNQTGFTDSVIVDSSNGLVITQFSNADNTNAAVEQTNTSLNVFHSATLAGHQGISIHVGDFDNTYFSTPASGFYYVCGPDSTGHETDLYRVGFTNTSGTIALGTVNGTPFRLTTTNETANCSPITEIFNTASSTDWLFLAVDNHGVTTTCNNQSCVMSFALGSSMVTGANASYIGPGNLNGTTGFIVDNVANTTSFPQASSIYFAPVANNLACGDGSTNTACGIKLTQSGLK